MFIKSYSSNDCKSMVCVQDDIRGVALIDVKGKIVHYIIYCIARDVLQKMVGLFRKLGHANQFRVRLNIPCASSSYLVESLAEVAKS